MCEINKISFIQETSFNMYNLHNSQIMLTHINISYTLQTLCYACMHTHARWLRCMGGKDFSGYDGRSLPPICLFVYMILTTKNKK